MSLHYSRCQPPSRWGFYKFFFFSSSFRGWDEVQPSGGCWRSEISHSFPSHPRLEIPFGWAAKEGDKMQRQHWEVMGYALIHSAAGSRSLAKWHLGTQPRWYCSKTSRKSRRWLIQSRNGGLITGSHERLESRKAGLCGGHLWERSKNPGRENEKKHMHILNPQSVSHISINGYRTKWPPVGLSPNWVFCCFVLFVGGSQCNVSYKCIMTLSE